MRKATAELILKDPDRFAHHDRVFLNNPVVMQGMGLAPLVVKDIFAIIERLRASGITILLIEQNANMALKTADLAYVLETGNITMSGTGAELLANEKVKEAYLGKHKAK